MYLLRHSAVATVHFAFRHTNARAAAPSRCCSAKRKTNRNERQTERDSHTTNSTSSDQLVVRGSFEDVTCKNRNTYLQMVHLFETKNIHRRNHVEFIYAALKNMEPFDVHQDIEVYKALMNVLPKGKFIPTNIFQSEFMHYPKQQQVIIDLLEQMEDNGVTPDHEMQEILINTFGRRGHPVRKYWRMLYWMPKFKNSSPWLLPNPVPHDALDLAVLAVQRMCTVDLQSNVQTYYTKDVANSIDDTWIVSGMSAEQSKLLQSHDVRTPLHIEGPFLVWLRNRSVNYFTLRGDTQLNESAACYVGNDDDVSQLEFNPFGLTATPKKTNHQSVHVQDDGTIYAICATGTSTKDSLLSWIRLLEADGNNALASIPVLFKFKSQLNNQIVPLS